MIYRGLITSLILVAALGFFCPEVSAKDHLLTARLIEAKSEGPGKIDGALSDIQSKLKSVFKYKQYNLLGSGKGFLSTTSSLKINLPKNQVLEAYYQGTDSVRLTMYLKWKRQKPGKSGVTLISGKHNLKPGETLLLGGPRSNGSVYILAVTAK